MKSILSYIQALMPDVYKTYYSYLYLLKCIIFQALCINFGTNDL